MTDELIRGRLMELTSELPGGPLMLPNELTSAARRRWLRRRRAASALAATSLALVAVAASTLAAQPKGQPSRAVTPVASGSPRLDASVQSVDFYGVRVDVPAGWRIDATRCGTPIADTVVRDNGDPTPACGFTGHKNLTVVHMTHPGLFFGAAYARVAQTPTTVGGMRALTGRGRPDYGSFRGPVMHVTVLLDQAVVVAVEGPDRKLGEHILGTLRPANVDDAGCQRQIRVLTPIGDAGFGTRDRFMPAGYDHVTVCRYQDNRLLASRSLSPQQANRLISAMDAAPLGRGDPDRAACAQASGTSAGWVVRGTYPDTPTREVFINDHPCHKRYVINGGRIAQLTPAVTQALETIQ